MIHKSPLCPQRVRKTPPQFSWLDQRLVRERHIESLTHAAATLYLFLVVVADSQGLSYYSDGSIMSRLSMDAPTLEQARRNLIGAGLVAFKPPLYQVLSLDPEVDNHRREALKHPLPIGQVLKQMMEKTS